MIEIILGVAVVVLLIFILMVTCDIYVRVKDIRARVRYIESVLEDMYR